MVLYKSPILEEFEWQQPVEDKDLSTPPAHVKAERYIIASGASGAWAGKVDNIALSTGSVWEFIIATEGMICWVKDEDKYYNYNGSSWSEYLGQQGSQGDQGDQGDQGAQGSAGDQGDQGAQGADGGGETDEVTKDINQSTHGFSVGDVLYFNGTIYAKAKADAASTAEVIGIVSTVTDNNNFTIQIGGYITGLSSLTAGSVYYLSASTTGALTETEPTTAGYISKPILVADSTTTGYFFNYRGISIASSNFPTFHVNKNSTNQTITSGASTLVTWSTEVIDTNNNFTSNRFTPTVAGKYWIYAQIGIGSVADGKYGLAYIYKNGAQQFRGARQWSAIVGSTLHVPVSGLVEANGTSDYFEIYFIHNHGSDRDINGLSTITYFQGFRIQQ